MEIRDVLEAFKKEIEKLYGKRLKKGLSLWLICERRCHRRLRHRFTHHS